MKNLLIVVTLLIAGCTSLSNVTALNNNLSFTIQNDRVEYFTGGLIPHRQARGLLKGTYTTIGEDEKGYYFLADSGGVVNMLGENAKHLELTGEYKETRVLGLWLAKDQTQKKKYDVFIILVPNYENMQGGLAQASVARLLKHRILFQDVRDLPDLSDIYSRIN